MYDKLLNIWHLSRVPCVVNGARMHLNIDETIQNEMYHGKYEPEQSAWFREYLCPGDIVVDIGASFGWYTALSRQLVGQTGKVFAFEPSPYSFDCLNDMVTSSGYGNVFLIKSAIGNTNGKIQLLMPTIINMHSPSIFMSDPEYIPIDVRIMKLDDFWLIEHAPTIKLLKMDVEGCEPDALKGMEGLIKAGKIKHIMCEFNSYWLKQNKTTPDELHNRFIELGYEVIEETEKKTCKDLFGEIYNLQDKLYKFSL